MLADPVSPLTVTKTATPNPVASGSQLTYTIAIVNTGGAKVTNVVMTDQVNGVGVIQSPPALPQLVVTSTQGSCSQGGPNGNVVSCQIGTMNGGKSVTVTIRGQVTASDGTTLNNTASVTGTKSAQNFTTTGSVSVLVSGGSGGSLADLTINKTGPSTVDSGAPIAYNLTVNNIGTANATNIKVVDTLPPDVAFVSTSTTSLFACSASATNPVTVTCIGGAVNAGQNGSITINGTAPNAGPPPATIQITNTAVVDPDNAIAESNELNNTSASVYTTVGGPAPTSLLSIVKTDLTPDLGVSWDDGAGPDPVTPGQKITYKIQVTNNATGTNSRADDVVVTDGTQGLEASSIVASQVVANGTVGNTGGCVVNAPQVRCSIRSLNSLGTLTITIVGTVVASAGTTIFNTATVTGNIKNTGVTATDSEETTVRPAVDLTITKDDSPDPVCARSWPTTAPNQHLANTANPPGPPAASGTPAALLAQPVCLGGLRYDMVIGNSGISNATGVVVRDPLPPGTIFDSYSTSGNFVCGVDPSNVVTCTGDVPGATPPESQSTVDLSFLLVAPPGTGSITNTVTVDPNNAIFEPDETNNTASQTTTVSTGVDLTVWKGDDSDPADSSAATPPLVPGSSTDLADGYEPIATRGTQTYTIYVDNVGTQDVTGIRLRDSLPADTVFLSVVANDPTHPADPTHGFTCAHDGSATGGVIECVGGHLLGTESEFYEEAGAPPPAPPGDDFATIKIRVFARSTVGTMHNEVRVDPLNEIAEVNELNNIASDDTTVETGDAGKGAYNQLKITKTQTDPSPTAGDPNFEVAQNGTLIYNLHVENAATDPVSAIVVKDFLPTGTRFIEAVDTDTGPAGIADAFFCTHDGSTYGGVITCTGGALSGTINKIPESPGPGTVPESRDIRVKVFAPNTPGIYPNLAKVDPDNAIAEGNEFDNASQITTKVTVGGNNMFNELNLTKVQSDPVTTCPAVGGVPCVATSSVVEYTLVVKNDGSDPAFQVKVRDTLPAGFTFISADDSAAVPDANAFQCTNTANVVNCISARIDGGGATRTIIVKAFSATQPGDYVNQAVVDPDNAIPEGNETNNTAQATTRVRVGAGFIDLKVTKAGPATITPGATITYDLLVENVGTDPAFNVALRDDLPDHTTFVSAVDTTAENAGAFSCALVGASIVCTGATLDGSADMIPGPPDVPASRTIQVKVLAPASIEEFASDQSNISLDVFNRAFVDPSNAIPESNETNNASASIKTTVSSAINLKLEKDGPGAATQNDTTTYTITVTNEKQGDGATAYGVKIVDPLPVGLIPLSIEADPGNFTCQLEENPVNFVTCIGDLETTKHVTITIKAFVTQDGGQLDNEACVDPDHTIAETNELDNCKHAIGQVEPAVPDMLINKTADKGSVTAGEALTYTLTVSNVGTADSTAQIAVSDTVPDELVVTDINEDTGWDCSTSSGNSVFCTRPDLPKGGSSHIEIRTTATGVALTGPFTNTANVIGGGESNANNNTDQVTTSVGGAAVDLNVVSLSDNPDPVNHDDTLTYTAIVRNDGTSGTGPGAIVRVVLPSAGVPVPSMTVAGTNGFSCSANTGVDASGKTFDCVGDFGASGTATDSTTITAQMTVAHTAPPPAQLLVTVTADPDGTFVESDETNNQKSETTTVSGTVCSGSPCVDLLATAFGTPVVNAGGVAIYNATVTNVGDAPVPGNVAWKIKLEFVGIGLITSVAPMPGGVTCTPMGTFTECTSVANSGDPMDLAPGESVTFTVTVTGLLPANGFALFEVTADATSVVTELTDGNNLAIVPTAIQP